MTGAAVAIRDVPTVAKQKERNAFDRVLRCEVAAGLSGLGSKRERFLYKLMQLISSVLDIVSVSSSS